MGKHHDNNLKKNNLSTSHNDDNFKTKGRQRPGRACDTCARSHKSCDRGLPCGRCNKLNKRCGYTDQRHRVILQQMNINNKLTIPIKQHSSTVINTKPYYKTMPLSICKPVISITPLPSSSIAPCSSPIVTIQYEEDLVPPVTITETPCSNDNIPNEDSVHVIEALQENHDFLTFISSDDSTIPTLCTINDCDNCDDSTIPTLYTINDCDNCNDIYSNFGQQDSTILPPNNDYEDNFLSIY